MVEKLQFNGSLSIGNVIQIVLIVVGMTGLWFKQEADVDALFSAGAAMADTDRGHTNAIADLNRRVYSHDIENGRTEERYRAILQALSRLETKIDKEVERREAR